MFIVIDIVTVTVIVIVSVIVIVIVVIITIIIIIISSSSKITNKYCGVLRRFAETTSPRETAQTKTQNPGS